MPADALMIPVLENESLAAKPDRADSSLNPQSENDDLADALDDIEKGE